jgi:flagellar assembly protein FliH
MTSSDPKDVSANSSRLDDVSWDRREATGPRRKNVPSPNANDATRAGQYARFIPREELGGFAAWQPGDIAGGPKPQRNVHRAPDEAPKVDIAAQLAEQLRAARQAGYQDGYRDGLVALDGFKQSFAAQTTAQIGALLESLGAELGGLQQDMARTLAITATHLARQIVRSELATQPALVAAVAQEALDTLLLSAQHITLRVHPADQPLVAQGAADVLAARGARLLGDASMSRGGCLVESDIGIIDATLETRWRRAAASLGCDEDWKSAEAPAEPAAPDTKIEDNTGGAA